MKWNEQQTEKLKELCGEGVSNIAIAAHLGCSLNDVYAKRSQLGITIEKCKGIAPNPEFEKAISSVEETLTRPVKRMNKEVREAFIRLNDALVLAMASDFTSEKDSKVYAKLATFIIELEDTFNFVIAGE